MMMLPHTVTLYIPRIETDPDTLEDRVTHHITLLKGVLLEVSTGVSDGESGRKSADRAALHIPFDAAASDGITGGKRQYAPYAAFRKAADRAGLWTLTDSQEAFFIRGEAVDPDASAEELGRNFGDVFRIVQVAELDFGGLRHWEVGGT